MRLAKPSEYYDCRDPIFLQNLAKKIRENWTSGVAIYLHPRLASTFGVENMINKIREELSKYNGLFDVLFFTWNDKSNAYLVVQTANILKISFNYEIKKHLNTLKEVFAIEEFCLSEEIIGKLKNGSINIGSILKIDWLWDRPKN